MRIKLPAAYDIAGSYETVADWSKVVPKPLIVFHKATEVWVDVNGVTHFYSDPKLAVDMAGMKANGIKRGVYHFHRKAISSLTQATYFCNYVRPIITAADYIVLDMEESGTTATQIKAWFDIVRAQFPANPLMIYSRKLLLDPIVMTEAQKTYFRQIPTWTAGYPFDPDLYVSVPASYIPDQTKWGRIWAWQYSEHGIVEGITGQCDLDWLAPEFIALLSPPVNTDVVTDPYNGVRRISGTRNGWAFTLVITDPAKVRYELVSTPQLETVPSVVVRKGAVFGSNAGEWNDSDDTLPTYLQPEDYTVSNGSVVMQRNQAVPSFMVLNDNSVVLDHRLTLNVKQAFSGLRYLITNGVVDPLLYGTEAKYTEGHARMIAGYNSIGHAMILLSQGAYPNQGLRLRDVAEIMKQYGCVKCSDFGGGGDAGGVLGSENLIVPENIVNGQHVYRRLPMTFLIYAEEPVMAKNKVTITWDAGAREREFPRVPNATQVDKMGVVLPDNSVHYSDVDEVPDSNNPVNVDKRWIKLQSGWYVATRYPPSSGTIYQRALVEAIVAPPVNKPASIDMTLAAGSVVTIKDASGVVLWTGTA